jgi:hypothetical protein
MSKTIVQLSLLDETGDSHHRMRWPGHQLAEMAPEWRVINLDFRAEERMEWGVEADLLVLLHCGDVDLLPLIDRRKALKKKTLIEINDNFYFPQPWNAARKRWDSPMMWRVYERLMEKSDGVIVTGPGLRDLLSSRCGEKIITLENHWPFPLNEDFEAVKKSKDLFALGWAGSAGHMADLLFVLPVLRELLSEFPEMSLHIMSDESTPGFLRLPESRIRFTPFGSIVQYFKFWENVSLGFVPLLDTPYNRCRSDIKAIEISAKGILPLLHEGVPYAEFINKTGAPTFKNLQDFKKLVSLYFQKPELREAAAKKCYTYVYQERQGARRRERLQIYEKMMEGVHPSSFDWKLPLGFHEVFGKAQTKPNLENPYNSEVALVKLRQTEYLPAERGLQEKFPEDIRFTLLAIRHEREEFERLKKWKNFFETFQKMKSSHQEVFRPAVLNLLASEISKSNQFFSIAEEGLQTFPLAQDFRWHLALAYERANLNAEALKHAQILLQKKTEFESSRAFFEQTPDYVFSVWAAALESRLDSV